MWWLWMGMLLWQAEGSIFGEWRIRSAVPTVKPTHEWYLRQCSGLLYATEVADPTWTEDAQWRIVPGLNQSGVAEGVQRISFQSSVQPGFFLSTPVQQGAKFALQEAREGFDTEAATWWVYPGYSNASLYSFVNVKSGHSMRLNGTLSGPCTFDSACSDVVEGDVKDINATFVLIPAAPAPPVTPSKAHNVLLLVSDDLRPQLGVYGQTYMSTPNLDGLGRQGTVFERAYIQYSFCCPSRNSFMSGRRPSATKVWNFIDHFREQGVGDTWTALPQYFRERGGYYTHGVGKVFHPYFPPLNDPPSWTDPGAYGQLPYIQGVSTDVFIAAQKRIAAVEAQLRIRYKCQGGCEQDMPASYYHQCTWCEAPEGIPGIDDAVLQAGVESLRMLAHHRNTTGQPFFLAVGFHKPHLPWVTPQRFFEPYRNLTVPPPANPLPPKGGAPQAWNKGLGAHSLESYIDTDPLPAHPNTPFPNETAVALRRAYYASVSYVDWMVGVMLSELEGTGVADDTVVAFLGDHGYQLGELNLWTKMTVFELGTRIPFIVRAPGISSGRTAALAEAVDLYPTLVDLAMGTPPVNVTLDGVSLKSVMHNPTGSVKDAAYSEFVKCYSCMNCSDTTRVEWHACPTGFNACPASPLHKPNYTCPGYRCDPDETHPVGGLFAEMSNCWDAPRTMFDLVGYSVRTDSWRYTEWLRWDPVRLHGNWSLPPVSSELYDHRGDDGVSFDKYETVNLAGDPRYADVVAECHSLLLEGFPTPVRSL